MPRKHPLPEIDRSIGARLKKFRESRLISQTDLASELGLSRAQLINYEEAISPVPWPVALRLHNRFELNPRWLVTGRMPEQLRKMAQISEPNLKEFSARAPLSLVYEKCWKNAVETETLKSVTFGFDPSQKVDSTWSEIVEMASTGWLQRIPRGREREFFLELTTEAERILARLEKN